MTKNTKSPVQKDVGQRGVRPHVGHSLVHDHHDKRREAEDEHHVDGADDGLPVLRVQSPRLLLVLAVVVLMMMMVAAQSIQDSVTIACGVSVTQPVRSTCAKRSHHDIK